MRATTSDLTVGRHLKSPRPTPSRPLHRAPSSFVQRSTTELCGFFQEAAKKHHHLDLNTLRGHTDHWPSRLDFSSAACNLTTGH
ncbi:hypothetical protein ZWY2020_025113 [Hordeum vulgare]|nr:hypothetical protein ZWY2020_025113 [Hordeum vulgare]